MQITFDTRLGHVAHSALVQIWSRTGCGRGLGSRPGHDVWQWNWSQSVKRKRTWTTVSIRWTWLWQRCNANFEGSDDSISGNSGESKLPISIYLRPITVLEVVRQWVVVQIADGGSGKFRRRCVLFNHLWQLNAALLNLGLYPETRAIDWMRRLVQQWLRCV